jgi:hypothetical protein
MCVRQQTKPRVLSVMLLVVSWHQWNVCETANETSSAQCDARSVRLGASTTSCCIHRVMNGNKGMQLCRTGDRTRCALVQTEQPGSGSGMHGSLPVSDSNHTTLLQVIIHSTVRSITSNGIFEIAMRGAPT